MLGGTRKINMSKSEVTEDNYIPVDKDKLKDEQKAELERATKAYEQECLKSFSATKAGEMIKKFDFPTLQPLTEHGTSSGRTCFCQSRTHYDQFYS